MIIIILDHICTRHGSGQISIGTGRAYNRPVVECAECPFGEGVVISNLFKYYYHYDYSYSYIIGEWVYALGLVTKHSMTHVMMM